MNVLVTGGAGFIGIHLTRRLLCEGCSVTILDNFNPQVHGEHRQLPPDLAPHVRLLVGDVRDPEIFRQASDGQDAVAHLAAETGTGQSMYEVVRYESVNIGGMAILMDYVTNEKRSRIQKIVVASSRAVYGEGKHNCPTCGVVYPATRQLNDLETGQFEPRCPRCNAPCASLPTDENTPYQPLSFYGLTKQAQEQMALMFAPSLGLSAFALRYQNVYGPGQSLKNPYTGILAIFANQARLGKPINVFEDGEESRDLVYIDDAVEATWQCIRSSTVGVEAINVGSGQRTTVRAMAQEIARQLGDRSDIVISGAFRAGDVRHSLADLDLARRRLGFQPRWTISAGLQEFLQWAQTQAVETIPYEQSLAEMRAKGLMHG